MQIPDLLQNLKIKGSNFYKQLAKNLSKDVIIKMLVITILVAYLIVINQPQRVQIRQSKDLLISTDETFKFGNHSVRLKNPVHHQQSIHISDNNPKWKLPRILWIYKNVNTEVLENFNTFRQLNQLNTRHFAQKSNYLIFQISQNNYHQHLSEISTQKIKTVIKWLDWRLVDKNYDEQANKQIRQSKQKIIKRLIIYFIMLQKGGVFVDDMVTIVESFDTWLENILNVVDVNLGDRNNPNLKPQCFGFYNKDFSSMRMKVDVERDYEFEKKLVVFPSLQDELIACDKQSQIMTKLIETYIDILSKEHKSFMLQKLNKNQILIGKASQWQLYNHGHILALHAILQQRQHLLNLQHQSNYKKLAIDDFGFVTINANLAFYKLKLNMGMKRQLYAFLAKLQMKYLPYLNGQLRFAYKLDNNIIAYFSQHLANDLNPPDLFLENSFFHTYLLKYWPKDKKYKDFKYTTPINQEELKNSDNSKKEVIELSEPQISPDLIEQENNWNNPQWQAIQKNIWVIWDKGLKGNSNLIVEICFQNLKKSAQKSGYKVNFVTDKTVHEYIDKQTLQRINYALTHADYPVSKQAETDLWRLALVYKHGGVYIDATTFTTEQNFDFIQNITRVPSGLIWNRYGDQPKNLMFWHGHWGHPSNWNFDYKFKTKKQWHLSFENNFIAAVKGSELIGQWLDQFMLWMVTDYPTIQFQMREVNMWNSRWIREDHRYLLAMDSIKYVIGRKQKWLKDTNNTQYESASHYYQIWGMTGNMNGQQKLRGETNYQNQDYRLYWADRSCNNLYRHQFSVQHAEYVLGPLSYQTKFFGFDSKFINNFLQNLGISHNYEITEQVLHEFIHPDSLLSKLLHTDIERSVQTINYYGKMRQVKTKFRAVQRYSFLM